ncbi:MAG: TfuA domain-containing protein [Candidatus Nitrosocaldus sp.]
MLFMNVGSDDGKDKDKDKDKSKIIIFLGPSLSRDKARSILVDAEYKPPARKGDLLKVASNANVIIGLIDGVFLQDYPPTPIEVYTAIARGAKVFGAASIGALRAVELERLGMKGIGTIFRLYKQGKIEGDDEVAVTFDSNDYSLHSEALIDIRYTLYHAYKAGVISNDTRRRLVSIAKGIYFPYRTYDAVISKAREKGISNGELSALESYIISNKRSLKEEDSIKLLRFLTKYTNNKI